jgi:predicted signal transduction protein with EAL and GGDEF domain
LEDVVCRLGGDEFVIIYPCIRKEGVVPFANTLLKLFDKAFEIADKQIYITASIGIAIYPKDGFDVNSILKNADAAMYKAKELGKNRYALYDEEMYLKLERKTHIQAILRTAIENKELSVYYQPQYNCLNNEIYGFEALLRLNSRELGSISPVEFIPIAEETGDINKIGKWVFTEACKQSYQWIQKGFRVKSMSINISAAQIIQPDFLDMVKGIIEETKININIIELEITETLLMQSIDSNIKVLEKLMEMGIRIALDDFGTGYSSLNYLRKIPLSTLKVDKSFIDNMSTSTKEEAIIENIIEMAHSMDLKVVAEGVEDEQQLSTLRNVKCDFIQGYYYSKPLPASEIEVLFKQISEK